MDPDGILCGERHGVRRICKWNLHIHTAHRIISGCDIQDIAFHNTGNIRSGLIHRHIVNINIPIHMTDLQKLRLVATDLLPCADFCFRGVLEQQRLVIEHLIFRHQIRTRRIHIGQHAAGTILIQLDTQVNIIVTAKYPVFPIRILTHGDVTFSKHIIDIDHHAFLRTGTRNLAVQRPYREDRLHRQTLLAALIQDKYLDLPADDKRLIPRLRLHIPKCHALPQNLLDIRFVLRNLQFFPDL